MQFSIWWPQKFLDFVKNWACGGRLKMATLIYYPISQQLFSNAHNLGLEWTFWGFSWLITTVWSLAIWWAQKFLNFGQISACGGCLKRATDKAFWLIFSNHHNFGLEWTFWTFSVLKMIVLSLAIWWAHKLLDLGLIGPCGGCSNRVPIKADFAIFQGGLLFVDFTLACCQPNVVINHKNTH